MLEKATNIKRFEYLPLGSGLKKHTSIAKDQYELFKDQINVVKNKREDGVKAEDGVETEDGEIIDNVHYGYFDDECKNLIVNIVKYELMDGDLRLTNFDNQNLSLKNTTNTYLAQKILIWMIDCLKNQKSKNRD